MHYHITIFLCACVYLHAQAQPDWDQIKSSLNPEIAIADEYDSAYRLPLATTGWEDGLHISADGLRLYCTYAPIDLLSFVLNGSLPNDFTENYDRGAETFGMDLVSNAIGADEWLHADILIAQRDHLQAPFTSWKLSAMSRTFYSEGAPSPTPAVNDELEWMVFTSNDNTTNNTDIWLIPNTTRNPTGQGTPAPAPVNSTYNEDNPHLVRLTTSHLLLFFDSDDRPQGMGDIDIWYTESFDDGAQWGTPKNLSSINSPEKEHQPFLHWDLDKQNWHLYFAANHSDGKPAIFRSALQTADDWDSWGNRELVVSAGNTDGIGEPTLTRDGDLAFVVVYSAPDPASIYDRFDADPWMLVKKRTVTSTWQKVKDHRLSVFPNPAQQAITLDFPSEVFSDLCIYDLSGTQVLYRSQFSASDKPLDISALKNGLYFLSAYSANGMFTAKFVKED